MYLQFVQQPAPRLELERLQQQAARHFAAEFEVLSARDDGLVAQVALTTSRLGRASFTLRARSATGADFDALGPAERANHSHGMANLGQRCASLWQIEPDPGVSRAACLFFGALTASIALGPLLPPDRSGLYGVRSARTLAEALLERDA